MKRKQAGVVVSDQIVGLINPGMSLIFAAGGFALWLRDRSLIYVLGYVFAALLIGFSFAINQYSNDTGQRAVQMLVAALSITAAISLVWSMCHRLGQRTPLLLWLAGALCTVALVFFVDHSRDVSASLLAVNCYCGVVMVMGAQIMSSAGSRQMVDRLLVWIFGLVAAQFFIRPITVIMLSDTMSTAEYRGSAGHAVLVVTAAMFTLVLTAAILAATISDQLNAVKRSARTDDLTGLLRRNAFEEQARAVMTKAREDNVTLSMVVADIDHFKQVNDRWGHPAGDAAIRGFSAIISGTIRPGDLAGRMGGEEFCILAWGCPGQAAGNLAERLRTALVSQAVDGIDADSVLTASFGVAEMRPEDGFDDLYMRADAALYRAKQQGRNRVMTDAQEAAAAELPDAVTPLPASHLNAPRNPHRAGRGQAAGLGQGAAIASGA